MVSITFMERYSRQIITSKWDQNKIGKSTVLVAGIGSLGCLSSINFSLMGVGGIILIDYDTVEVSNLNRQLLFNEDDVGKLKSEVARTRLARINPSVKIESYTTDIRSVETSVFQRADVILDSLDSYEARRWINSTSVSLRKPLVHAGVYGWWGNVQVIIPYETPCLECQPLIPKSRLQKYCSPPGQKRRKIVKASSNEIPMINTTCMVISGIQCQEALKIILEEKRSLLREYLFYDGYSETFTRMEVDRNPNCIVCSEKYVLNENDFAISDQEDVREAVSRLNILFGAQEPKIIYRSRVLEPAFKFEHYGISDGDIIYVVSKSFKAPIKLKCKKI